MKLKRISKNEYPLLLRQVERAPQFLDVAGTLPPDDYKYLCVIGARRYSSYGNQVCKALIEGLRGYPIVIVSGLAVGIDSLAHRYALESGLKTISFPGSGLSERSMYPSVHLNLALDIVEQGGALLSPFEPQQLGTRWTFPVRNELMAACSHATLIIESRQKSGTMITARAALNLGRDVLVVPGSIFSELSSGPHALLGDGATPITSSTDILRALGFENVPLHTNSLFTERIHSLPSEQQKILRLLQFESRTTSELIEHTGLTASELNIHLSNFELEGLIRTDSDSISLECATL
jgi:DNA processing protein